MARNSKHEGPPETEVACLPKGHDASWYASAEGRRQTEREFAKAFRQGSVVRSSGINVPLTDSAVLADLVAKAKARATKAISIRLSVADLERARELADQEGVGYQTILKRAIQEGLKKVS